MSNVAVQQRYSAIPRAAAGYADAFHPCPDEGPLCTDADVVAPGNRTEAGVRVTRDLRGGDLQVTAKLALSQHDTQSGPTDKPCQ